MGKREHRKSSIPVPVVRITAGPQQKTLVWRHHVPLRLGLLHLGKRRGELGRLVTNRHEVTPLRDIRNHRLGAAESGTVQRDRTERAVRAERADPVD